MNRRAGVVPVVAAAVIILVAAIGGSSPAARPDPDPRSLDVVASAHPTSVRTTVREAAYDDSWVLGAYIKADAAALTSTTCDGCVGESSALQIVYAGRARHASLDNVANAWAQECSACTSTALSVQVVLLRGRPVAMPNNRALSVTAACHGCRTAAHAFQVVLVADRTTPMSGAELAELRAWFDEQSAALRASVAGELTEPQPTPSPTPSPTPTISPTVSSTVTPTLTPATSPPPTRPTSEVRPVPRVRRDAGSALRALEELLADALDAETVSTDVDVSR